MGWNDTSNKKIGLHFRGGIFNRPTGCFIDFGGERISDVGWNSAASHDEEMIVGKFELFLDFVANASNLGRDFAGRRPKQELQQRWHLREQPSATSERAAA